MARITHPRFQAGRVTEFGIEFIDGFAETDLGDNEVLRLALVQHGFGIDETVGLDDRTVAELRTELEDLGYDVKTSWRKPELIERLAQHRELNTEKVSEGYPTIVGEPIEGEPSTTGPFATATLLDGTVIGDGKSIATLPAAE